MKHIRALDGLRGIAVLLVVVYHFSPDHLPGGFIGVDIFFVLSGFLITSLLVTERDSSGRIHLRSFWVRRARRLFPALLIVIIAIGLHTLFYGNALAVDAIRNDGLASLFYVANWHFIISGQSYIEQFVGVDPSPFRHTWSLAIEEQYYLIWPLIVAAVGYLWLRRVRRTNTSVRPVVVATGLVLTAISTLAMALLFNPNTDLSRVYYGTDSRSHLLLIGSVLGAMSAGVLEVRRRNSQFALIVGGSLATIALIALALTVNLLDSWLYRGGYLGFAVLVALIIAGVGQPGVNPLAKLLSLRPLVGLGLISYGVYLWHWPIFLWVNPDNTGLNSGWLFALRSVLTLAVSIVSFLVIEQPIRRGALRRLGPAVPWIAGPVAVGLAVLVLLIPTWITSTSVPLALDSISGSAALATKEYSIAPRCDAPPASPLSLKKTRVFLYGNSIAGEVTECLEKIVVANGGTYVSATVAGAGLCDFLPQVRGDSKGLVKGSSAVAVIFALPVKISPCTGGSGALADCTGECYDTLLNKFTVAANRMTRRFTRKGIPVILVPPIPLVDTDLESPVAARYRTIAAKHPNLVTVADAGRFLRNDAGIYQLFMPCSPVNEVGCTDGTLHEKPTRVVWVRLFFDGIHLCADPDFTDGCAVEYSGGERRAAAAIADAIIIDSTRRR